MRGKPAGQIYFGSTTAQKKSWEMCDWRCISSQHTLDYGVSHVLSGFWSWRIGERQSLRVLQGLLGSRLELTIDGLSSLTLLCLWELQG